MVGISGVFISIWLGLNVPAEGATIQDFYRAIPYFDSLENLEISELIEPVCYLMALFFALTLTLVPVGQWGLDILAALLFMF